MLKFTFKMLMVLLPLAITINGAERVENESSDIRLNTARAFSKELLYKEARIEYISISEDSDLEWNLRLQALDELSNFNPIAAVQGYLRLLHTDKSRPSVKLMIKIRLTRLTPDLTKFQRIVGDPRSKPLDHFNAACFLQDWMCPEHAVFPFELLLKKIQTIRRKLYPISNNPDEKEYCQKHNECLPTKTEHLEKLYDASTAIIFILESQFIK